MMTDTTQILAPIMQHLDDGPYVTLLVQRPTSIEAIQPARIKLKNLMKEAKNQFTQLFPNQDWEDYRTRLRQLSADADVWLKRSATTLAFVVGRQTIRTFDLDTEVSEHAYVAHLPNILPLIEDLQTNFNYLLVTLNQDSFGLYRGTNQHLQPIKLPNDAPTTLTKALGEEIRGGELNFSNKAGGGVAYHGHTDRKTEMKKDQKRYYQIVDSYITDHYSNPQALPTIVMGVPENQAVYRQLTKNQWLSDSVKLEQSSIGLTHAELEGEMATVLNQVNHERLIRHQARYQDAKSQQKTSTDAVELAKLAHTGRIQTLFIKKDAEIAGMILTDGTVDRHSTLAQASNLLVDKADFALRNKGEVIVVDESYMPEDSSVAAILRY